MKKIFFLLFFLSFLTSAGLLAQGDKITVRGVVTDKGTGESLIGVGVFLDQKPPKGLAATNARGEFTVVVPANSTLLFKSIGFSDQRVTLKPGQTKVEVKLRASENMMQEVVIRGYAARTKEVTTGSSISVTGKEIQDIPVANAEQLLQGKVPGLNVQVNTGAPGFRGSVLLRGLSGIGVSGTDESSFLSPTSPLYVIDGIPIDADATSDYGFNTTGPAVSPLSLIPPEDIQNIEVLKDAQATSLYGSRGAYGVIIITTRRGNSKVPRVRFDSKFYMNAVPKLRETLGGQAERQAKLQQIRNFGRAYTNFAELLINVVPALSDSINPYYNNSTDWQSVFYGNTYNHTQNLSIDGGDDIFNYKTNFKWFNSKGIIANTGFNSYTTNMNMNYKPNKKFNLFVNVLAGLGKQNKGSGQGLFQTGVAQNSGASSLLPGPSLFQATNGVLSVFNVRNDNLSKSLRANTEFSFMPFEGLRILSSGSYDFTRGTEETFTPAVANQNRAKVYSFNNRKSILYNRNTINYNKSIDYTHNFNVLLFNEISKRSFQSGYILQVGTPNDQIQGPLGSSAVQSRGGGTLDNYYDVNTVSFAGAFSYDFMRKYVLDLTYRVDASSLAGFDNPYSQNPSVGVRWNFNKEQIFENSNWISFGDIRASWGKNIIPAGNIYTLFGTYQPNGSYTGSPRTGIDYGLIPNNTLKPTTNTTYNFGFDLGLFSDRLTFNYDTYLKKVSNLLWDLALPTTTGFTTVKSDQASLINYGHELSINVRPLSKTSPVNLSINVNGAYNRDALMSLPGGKNQILSGSTILRVGRNTLSNYMIVTNGVYSTKQDVPVDPVTGLPYRAGNTSTSYFQAGDPKWQDLNGDYILNDADKQIIGNSQPFVTGGLTTNLGYKGFSLLLTGTYTIKRSVINSALSSRLNLVRDPYGSSALLKIDDIDYWQGIGDVAKYANPYDYTRSGMIDPFRSGQSLFQEDGSYFKLNTATLGYTFKKDFVKKLNIHALKLYLSAYNIFTISPYSGPNPEAVTALGYDASNGYPVARIYNVGFNIEL